MSWVDEILGFCSATWGVHNEHLCVLDHGHLEKFLDTPVPYAPVLDVQMHECDCGDDIYDEDLKEQKA